MPPKPDPSLSGSSSLAVIGDGVGETREPAQVEGVARRIERERAQPAGVEVADDQLAVVGAAETASDRQRDARSARSSGTRRTPGRCRSSPCRACSTGRRALAGRATSGPMSWFQPLLKPGRDEIHLVVVVRSVLGVPQTSVHGIERHAEAVAHAVGVVLRHLQRRRVRCRRRRRRCCRSASSVRRSRA